MADSDDDEAVQHADAKVEEPSIIVDDEEFWTAVEDLADYFLNDGSPIVSKRVWEHRLGKLCKPELSYRQVAEQQGTPSVHLRGRLS